MTGLLKQLLGRMPIGWLQLVSNKVRFASAIAGVAFACILVFVQLGMMGAFTKATRVAYTGFDADIMISSSNANSLTDGSNVARRRMYQSLAVPGVSQACPLFLGMTPWILKDGSKIEFQTIGVDPGAASFFTPAMGRLELLQLANNVFLDRSARGLDPEILAGASPAEPIHIEANNEQLSIVSTVDFGGGFAGDGYMVVSDQTFIRLFRNRISGSPNHILLKVEQGEDVQVVVNRLKAALPTEAIKIRSFEDAIDEDVNYQLTKRPVGLIFGFGVVIGAIVGVVIVYQILSTDVADHLREYATFKAMGYSQKFFQGIVLEEAVILAVAGFVPAFFVSIVIYAGMANATGLPIEMTLGRAASVFAGTVVSCALSGMFAMRKLAGADPADLF